MKNDVENTSVAANNKSPRQSGAAGTDQNVNPVPKDDLNHELFERNLKTFARFQSHLATQIRAIETPHSQLISDGDGG